jgi:hypothetical protein
VGSVRAISHYRISVGSVRAISHYRIGGWGSGRRRDGLKEREIDRLSDGYRRKELLRSAARDGQGNRWDCRAAECSPSLVDGVSPRYFTLSNRRLGEREKKAPGKGRDFDRLMDGCWRGEWLRFITRSG